MTFRGIVSHAAAGSFVRILCSTESPCQNQVLSNLQTNKNTQIVFAASFSHSSHFFTNERFQSGSYTYFPPLCSLLLCLTNCDMGTAGEKSPSPDGSSVVGFLVILPFFRSRFPAPDLNPLLFFAISSLHLSLAPIPGTSEICCVSFSLRSHFAAACFRQTNSQFTPFRLPAIHRSTPLKKHLNIPITPDGI